MYNFYKPKAIEILGESHIAVIRSAHRAELKHYQEEVLNGEQQKGGIMNWSSASKKSIFPSRFPVDNTQETWIDNDTLSMLEEGAASYDGSSVPMGGEDVEVDAISFGTSSQRTRAKANAYD